MLKKLLLAVLLVFCITAGAYAAPENNVQVQTDNPPVPKGACGQAGSLSLTFANKTEVNPVNGTIIARLTPGVTLCRTVDFYVRIADNTSKAAKLGGVIQGNFTAIGVVGADVTLRVKGVMGAGELSIMPLNGTLRSGDNEMKIVLFDEKAAPAGELLDASVVSYNSSNGKFYNSTKVGALGGADFNEAQHNVAAEDNVLCVAVPDAYAAGTVQLYLESVQKLFTFLKPDNVIAVIGGGITAKFVDPKIPNLTAPLAEAGDQAAAATCDKEYETGTGLCTPNYAAGKRGHLAIDLGAPLAGGLYTIEMEILVDGVSGDHGAYFAAAEQGIQLADKVNPTLTNPFGPTGTYKNKGYFNGETKVSGTPTGGCTREDKEKITKFRGTVDLKAADVAGKKYLRFNVPTIAVPGLTATDVVSVRVALRKGACKTLFEGTRELFTMVKACSEAAGTGALFFPYFAGTVGNFWNGLALVNPGSEEVNATLEIVEEKGNTGKLTLTVPAKGIVVKLVENLSKEPGFQAGGNNTGEMGEARSYINVKTTGGNLKGFAMMSNGGDSMGYTVP